MSLAAMLRQSLVVERATEGAQNDYGESSQTWATLATVRGLIQPRKATEVALLNQGGATMTDTVIFLEPTDILAADRIRLASATTGPYYEITGVRDAAGHGHHLELDANVVS